jgi:hypothetical protein
MTDVTTTHYRDTDPPATCTRCAVLRRVARWLLRAAEREAARHGDLRGAVRCEQRTASDAIDLAAAAEDAVRSSSERA